MFNDYDENGYRTNKNGNRSSRIEDAAIVSNLRFRWPQELAEFNDVALINAYDDFVYSDMWGDNDERFLDWIKDYGD